MKRPIFFPEAGDIFLGLLSLLAKEIVDRKSMDEIFRPTAIE